MNTTKTSNERAAESKSTASTPALAERGAVRPSNAAPLYSRRCFIGAAVLGTAGLAVPGIAVIIPRNRWTTVREIIAAGAIGQFHVASAIVPTVANAATREQFGHTLPETIVDTLDGFLVALDCGRPRRVEVSEHIAIRAVSLTCTVDGGNRIAIATAAPDVPFTATLRGTTGALYVGGSSIVVDSGGQWRSVGI